MDDSRKIGAEAKSPLPGALSYQLLKVRLKEGYRSFPELTNALLVIVYAGYVVSYMSQASSCDEPYVACSYHPDPKLFFCQ